MGSIAQEYLKELNPTADLDFLAQQFNEESYAICKADILIKGEEARNIRFGNTLSNDAFAGYVHDDYGVGWY